MICEEALYQVYVPLRFTFSTHVTQCRLYSGRFSFCGEDCVLGQQGINAQTIRSALAQVISLSLRFDFFRKRTSMHIQVMIPLALIWQTFFLLLQSFVIRSSHGG